MDIIFEDKYILVVNKPSGLSTESGAASHPSAEKEALAMIALRRPGDLLYKGEAPTIYLRAVHRLDRASSGVLVMAKSKTVLTQLMGQFERRETEKTYTAIVEGIPIPASGTLSHFLKRAEGGKKALVSASPSPGAQPCELNYKVLSKNDSQTEIEVQPVTGRFHQIRAQFAFISCPIVGDVLYNGLPWREHQIKLHAGKLLLKHPVTSELMEFVAPLKFE